MNILLVLLALINIEFSWDAQSDATGYKVATSTTSGGPYTDVDVGWPNPVSGRVLYVWHNWDTATKKYVVVKAYNTVGDSDPSTEIVVTARPGKPTNVKAKVVP